MSEVVPSAEIVVDPFLIETHRMIKSDEEIALIKESCKWGNLAHRFLQDYSKPGATENEISIRASLDATLAMIRLSGPCTIQLRLDDLEQVQDSGDRSARTRHFLMPCQSTQCSGPAMSLLQEQVQACSDTEANWSGQCSWASLTTRRSASTIS